MAIPMTMEPDTNRPYAPPSNVIAVLHRLRSRNLPERIDAEYLRDAGISEGTLNRALFALRFLHLIGEAGEPTQALRTIHTSTDEEYRETVAGLVREAYADVFNSLDPAEDTQDRILNFFRRYTPASQRARMVMFFLGVCREAGIPTLDAPRQRSMAEPRTGQRTPRAAGPRERERGSKDEDVRQRGHKVGRLNPALEGLIAALPIEGKRLSENRRKQWLQMAEATLTFIYGEPEDGTDEEETGTEA